MAEAFKVEVISKDTIKPSSPTPDEHGTASRLSLFDQLSPAIYSPVLLFYPADAEEGERLNDDARAELASTKSQKLRSSLPDVLTRLYPLAGRIRGNFSIDYDDECVAYHEAKVNCLLKDVLERPDLAALRKLLPIAMESTEAVTGFLLLVQASFFECGGLALGVCISHKVADAASLGTFIRVWASSALDEPKGDVIAPSFTMSSAFPPQEDLKNLPVADLPKGSECVTRRYVFDSSKVAMLRAKVKSLSLPVPTRVEAVTALIWKCTTNASRRKLGAPSRQSVLGQAVNLRRRLPQPLPEHSIGNMVGGFMACNEDPETDLLCLVSKLRTSMGAYLESYPKRLDQPEDAVRAVFETAGQYGALMSSQDIDFYNCSSWCKLPFYQADFGWGKPVWVGWGSTEFKDSIVLIDAKDGEGVEAWLTLKKPVMEELDRDQELLAFASLNPSITW